MGEPLTVYELRQTGIALLQRKEYLAKLKPRQRGSLHKELVALTDSAYAKISAQARELSGE